MRFFVHPEGNLVVAIVQDEYPPNPRQHFQNLGHMHCFTRAYDLGDPHDWPSFAELQRFLRNREVISLPLYLLDHSGLSINTHGFEGCDPQGWDWGLVGYIWCTREEAKAWFGRKRWSKKLEGRVLEILEAEVQEYDLYLRGEVFALAIYKYPYEEPEEVISGFYGEEQAEAGVREIFYERLGVTSGLIELFPDKPPPCPNCGRPLALLEAVYGIHGWAEWKGGCWEEAYDNGPESSEYRCAECIEDVTVLVSLQGLVHRISHSGCTSP